MQFDPKLTMIAVGLYNGDIEIYRVLVEKNYQNYEDVIISSFVSFYLQFIFKYCVIKRHTAPVTGIHMDYTTGNLRSMPLIIMLSLKLSNSILYIER